MNTIIMKCGHVGPAVGAPGSLARALAEQSDCIDCEAGDPILCNVSDMTLTDTQKELAICAIKKIKGIQNSSPIVTLFKCEADALLAFVKGIDS